MSSVCNLTLLCCILKSFDIHIIEGIFLNGKILLVSYILEYTVVLAF